MCQDSEYNRPDFVALRDLHAQDMTINTNMPTTQSGNNMNHSSPAKNYQSPVILLYKPKILESVKVDNYSRSSTQN